MIKLIRWTIGALLVLVSILMVLWGVLPNEMATIRTYVNLHGLENVTDGSRIAYLFYPTKVKVGCSEKIKLNIFANQEKNEVGENKIQNLDEDAYPKDGDNILETRLVISGFTITPYNTYQQLIDQDTPLRFEWVINTAQKGSYDGTVWIYKISKDPKKGTKQKQVLAAQRVKIKALQALGLNCFQARVIGVIGFFLGLALIIDGLYNLIAGYFIK